MGTLIRIFTALEIKHFLNVIPIYLATLAVTSVLFPEELYKLC